MCLLIILVCDVILEEIEKIEEAIAKIAFVRCVLRRSLTYYVI